MKKCGKCQKVKNLDEFYDDRRRKNGKQSKCKSCALIYVHEYFKSHPERNRAKALRYQKKMKSLGRCVICGKKAVTKYYCQKHREEQNAKRRK